MIRFENAEVMGWEAAIRGMRNPMNSWEKGDSGLGCLERTLWGRTESGPKLCKDCSATYESRAVCSGEKQFVIGPNDYDLMKRLRNAGTDHRKFMRMITVYVDITAPLYWWKEFDTYKVGTVANSCSTMHKIAAKEFTLEDFSCEHLFGDEDMIKWDERTDIAKDHALAAVNVDGNWCYFTPKGYIQMTCNMLNRFRQLYLETKDKRYWWQMIQLLPSSYNQKRTVMLNYEVLANIYKSRRNHKLDEWALSAVDQYIAANPEDPNGSKSGRKGFGFCDWIKTLPYSELITGEDEAK